MNVLVTGGGGFLGSHLARHLLEMGHRVSVLGRHRYPDLPPNIIQHQAEMAFPTSTLHFANSPEALRDAMPSPKN